MLIECYKDYLKLAEEIIEQWHLIFAINFYIYKEWYKSEKAKFKCKKRN
jgi:hypothetical protein